MLHLNASRVSACQSTPPRDPPLRPDVLVAAAAGAAEPAQDQPVVLTEEEQSRYGFFAPLPA